MAIPLQMDKNPENSWSLQAGVLKGMPDDTFKRSRP
jgi:hypothetical protein